MPASTTGKNILPRAAALMRSQPITDVISILSESKFKRPIYAGNAIATVERIDIRAPLMMTVRPTSFDSVPRGTVAVPVESIHDDEVTAIEVGSLHVMPKTSDCCTRAVCDHVLTNHSYSPYRFSLTVQDQATQGLSQWIANEERSAARPDLGTASVVVSGGRALKSAEHFTIIEELADELGGAVGASRAAVDAGMVANDLQVSL